MRKLKLCFALAAMLAFGFCLLGLAPYTVAYAKTDENQTQNEEITGETIEDEETPIVDENDENSEDLEGNTNVIPKTQEGAFFDEYVMPALVSFFAPLAGVLVGGLLLFKGLNKSKGLLSLAVTALSGAKTQTETAQESLTNAQAQMQDWQKQQEKKLEEKFNELANSVADKVSDTNKTVHKILTVEQTVCKNVPTLVSNGTAKRVSEVIAE